MSEFRDVTVFTDDTKRGVYVIECSATGNAYVGSTSNFSQRWAAHKTLLEKGRHYNPTLQDEWNQYGETAFSFSIERRVPSPEPLAPHEQECINARGSANRLPARVGRPGHQRCLSDETYARVRDRVLDRELLNDWAEIELREIWKAQKRPLPIIYEPNTEKRRARWKEWNDELDAKRAEIKARHFS